MLKPKRRIRREIEETGGEIETGTGVTVETEIEVCGLPIIFCLECIMLYTMYLVF